MKGYTMSIAPNTEIDKRHCHLCGGEEFDDGLGVLMLWCGKWHHRSCIPTFIRQGWATDLAEFCRAHDDTDDDVRKLARGLMGWFGVPASEFHAKLNGGA